MIIGGLLPFSTIDFPGDVSSVIFTQGCNLRCPYCHNPELIPLKTETEISSLEIIKTLEGRKNLVDAVVISGGEPTLQKDLLEFLIRLKTSSFKVKLDTNASNPEMVSSIVFNDAVDFISVDVKTSPKKYSQMVGTYFDFTWIKKTIEILEKASLKFELRTTAVPGIVGKEDIEEIGKEIGGDRAFVIQQFNPSKTLDQALGKIKPYDNKKILELIEIAETRFSRVKARGIL